MRNILTILSLMFVLSVNAQQYGYRTFTNLHGTFGISYYLPPDWGVGGNKSPVMIVSLGSGEIRSGVRSTDSARCLAYGPMRARILNWWNGIEIFPDGQPKRFAIFVYQPPTNNTGRTFFNRWMDTILTQYAHIDTMRMYYFGLSRGGQQYHHHVMYTGASTSGNGTFYENRRFAAAAIWSTPEPTGLPRDSILTWLRLGGRELYGIGKNDNASYIRASEMNQYNVTVPNSIRAFEYVFPGTNGDAHGGWNTPSNPTWRDTASGLTMYQWLVQTDKYPKANAGADKSITLPTSFVTLNGQTAGWVNATEWSQISGPAAAFINSPLNDTTTVSSLVEGIYVFRLRSYNGSNYADDYVTVSVNPEPVTPPDPTDPNAVLIKKKGHKIIVVGGTYTPPTPEPVDTIVAQFFFTRNVAVQTDWVNVAGNPHSAIRTGIDTRHWKSVSVSSVATNRWTALSGNSSTDASGESTPNPSYYFPATVTLGYWFTSETVQSNPMLEISNLEQGSVKYKIEIGASRDDAAVSQSERNCYYICTDEGGNETSANLNVKGNTNRVITFTNKEADSNGKIYLIINPTNLDGSTFGYLGAIRVTKLKP